jgi:hypothetical protein
MTSQNNLDTKQCSKCLSVKLITEFRKNRLTCRACEKEYKVAKYSGDRICTKCKIFKKASDFYDDGQSDCKDCKREFSFNKLRIIKSDEAEYLEWLQKHNKFSRDSYQNLKDEWDLGSEAAYFTYLWNTFRSAKKRAKSLNFEFTLDFDHILKLWDQQKGKCASTGMLFSLENYLLSGG